MLLREESIVLREHYCIVRSSAGYKDQPCSWVHKEGREGEKERER
jgi:hypothetical protein